MSAEYEQLHSIKRDEFENVWNVFQEIGIEERHFNQLQSSYRTLASTWLLAGFTGIGFVISKETINVPIDRLLIVAGIGLAISIGLIMLWNLDLMVYHQLLSACFEEGLMLEKKYPWLPSIRINMMARMKGRGVIPRVVWFYVAGNTVSLSISAVGLIFWVYNFGLVQAIVATTIYCIVIGLLALIIVSAVDKESGLRKNRSENVTAK